MKKYNGKKDQSESVLWKVKISIRTFSLALCLLLALFSNAKAEEKQQSSNSLKQWDNLKEYTANLDKSGSIFWCGKDELAIWINKGRDMKSIAFYKHKNNLETVSEETIKIDAGESYSGHSCSQDGRYVYLIKSTDYKENNKRKSVQDFTYYDRNTKSVHTIFSYGAESGVSHKNTLISPQGKYFIGPSKYNKLTVTGIGNAKIIGIDTLLAVLPNTKRINFDLAWDYLDHRIYLLDIDAQAISIIDPETLKRETINVKLEKDYKAYEIKSVNEQLFISAACQGCAQKDIQRNIYLLDLANKKKPVTLFLADIDSFDISPTGIFVYSKTNGARSYAGDTIFDNKATKRFVIINLINDNREEAKLKKFYFNIGGNNEIIFAQLASPIISEDGCYLVFITRIDNKLHVMKRK